MIREHGPAHSTTKLCLFTVNAFMNDEGFCWPSQASIAKAASLTENTVQRLLAEAIDYGWLGVESHAIEGKEWKRYSYRAAVPDRLDVAAPMITNEALIDAFTSKHGPIYRGGRPFKRKSGTRTGVREAHASVTRTSRVTEGNGAALHANALPTHSDGTATAVPPHNDRYTAGEPNQAVAPLAPCQPGASTVQAPDKTGEKPGQTPDFHPSNAPALQKVPLLKSQVPLLNTEGGHFKVEGPHSDDALVPLHEGTKSSFKFSEKSSLKFPYEGAVASDSTRVLEKLNLKKAEEAKAETLRKARKAKAAGWDDQTIRKQFGEAAEEVLREATAP